MKPELEKIQRRMLRAVLQPLTPDEHMRKNSLQGRSMRTEAEAIIRPNDRLTSFERLEIYNRQYWFRIIGCFHDDFPGLHAILGGRRFEKLALAYLQSCPSRSYTLRNLGSCLATWLRSNPEYAGRHFSPAMDMVRLEWAHIEAFDAAEHQILNPDDLATLNADPDSLHLKLQPYLHLLRLSHPVDAILLAVRKGVEWSPSASNAVSSKRDKPRAKDFSKIPKESVCLAVHRQENTVYYKRLVPEACRLLKALARKKTLSQAVAHAFYRSRISEPEQAILLQGWFANWASLGWFQSLSTHK